MKYLPSKKKSTRIPNIAGSRIRGGGDLCLSLLVDIVVHSWNKVKTLSGLERDVATKFVKG